MTEETTAKVAGLVIAGINQPDIAKVMGISEDTLQRKYRETLDISAAKTLANIANTLVQKALNGDTASIIFYLKTRGKKQGWSERIEVTGADGDRIKSEVSFDPSSLTEQQLISLLEIAGGGASSSKGD